MALSEEEWDRIRRSQRSNQRAPGWPEKVTSISLEYLALLGVDDENRLYWDGQPIEIRRRLVLTRWQKLWAAIVSVAIVIGGVGGAAQGLTASFDFGCKKGWWSCPPPAEHPPQAVAPSQPAPSAASPQPAPQNLLPGTKFR
jgi:hypothetical protein